MCRLLGTFSHDHQINNYMSIKVSFIFELCVPINFNLLHTTLLHSTALSTSAFRSLIIKTASDVQKARWLLLISIICSLEKIHNNPIVCSFMMFHTFLDIVNRSAAFA